MRFGHGPSTRDFPFRFLLLAVFLVSCSTHPQASSHDGADLRGLIRAPARMGGAGVDQTVATLQARYKVPPGTALSPLVNTKQPLTLDDGAVVVQTLTDLNATGDVTRDLRLDMAAQPCLPVARAAAWIGARRLSATPGSDTVTGHVDYRFESAQVRIDLTGEFGGQECLRVIEIYKQP